MASQGYNVGSLFVDVGLDISPVREGLAQMEGLVTSAVRSMTFQLSQSTSQAVGNSLDTWIRRGRWDSKGAAIGARVGQGFSNAIDRVLSLGGLGVTPAARGNIINFAARFGQVMAGALGGVVSLVGQGLATALVEGMVGALQLALTSRLGIVKGIMGGSLNAVISGVKTYGEEQRNVNKANFLLDKSSNPFDKSDALKNSQDQLLTEVATQTSKTRAEVAELNLQLARAGMSRSEIVGGISAEERKTGLGYNTVMLAEAADLPDMKEAAFQISNLSNAFKNNTKEEIAGGLLGIQSSTLHRFENLKFAWQDAAPAAGAAGVQYKDFMQAMSVLLESGTPEVEGTAMKSFLQFLNTSKPGSEGDFNQFNDAFKRLTSAEANAPVKYDETGKPIEKRWTEETGLKGAFTTEGKFVESILMLRDAARDIRENEGESGIKIEGVTGVKQSFKNMSKAEQDMLLDSDITRGIFNGDDTAQTALRIFQQKYTTENGQIDLKKLDADKKRLDEFLPGQGRESQTAALVAVKNKGLLGGIDQVSSSLDNILSGISKKLEGGFTSFFGFFLETFNRITARSSTWSGAIERINESLEKFFNFSGDESKLTAFQSGIENLFANIAGQYENFVNKVIAFFEDPQNINNFFNKLNSLIADTVASFSALLETFRNLLPLINDFINEKGFSPADIGEKDAKTRVESSVKTGNTSNPVVFNKAEQGGYFLNEKTRVYNSDKLFTNIETDLATNLATGKIAANGLSTDIQLTNKSSYFDKLLNPKLKDVATLKSYDVQRVDPETGYSGYSGNSATLGTVKENINSGKLNANLQSVIESSISQVPNNIVDEMYASQDKNLPKGVKRSDYFKIVRDSLGTITTINTKTNEKIENNAEAVALLNNYKLEKLDPKNNALGLGQVDPTFESKNFLTGSALRATFNDKQAKDEYIDKTKRGLAVSQPKFKNLPIEANEKAFIEDMLASNPDVRKRLEDKGALPKFNYDEESKKTFIDRNSVKEQTIVEIQALAERDLVKALQSTEVPDISNSDTQKVLKLISLVNSGSLNPEGAANIERMMNSPGTNVNPNLRLLSQVSSGQVKLPVIKPDGKPATVPGRPDVIQEEPGMLPKDYAERIRSGSDTGLLRSLADKQINPNLLDPSNLRAGSEYYENQLKTAPVTGEVFVELINKIKSSEFSALSVKPIAAELEKAFNEKNKDGKFETTQEGKDEKGRIKLINASVGLSQDKTPKADVDANKSTSTEEATRRAALASKQALNKLSLESLRIQQTSINLNTEFLSQQKSINGYVNETAKAFSSLSEQQSSARITNDEQIEGYKQQIDNLRIQATDAPKSLGVERDTYLGFINKETAKINALLVKVKQNKAQQDKVFAQEQANLLERTSKEQTFTAGQTLAGMANNTPVSGLLGFDFQYEQKIRPTTQALEALKSKFAELTEYSKSSQFGKNIKSQIDQLSNVLPVLKEFKKIQLSRLIEDITIKNVQSSLASTQKTFGFASTQQERIEKTAALTQNSGNQLLAKFSGSKTQSEESKLSFQSDKLQGQTAELESKRRYIDASQVLKSDPTNPLFQQEVRNAYLQLTRDRQYLEMLEKAYILERTSLLKNQQLEILNSTRELRNEAEALIDSLATGSLQAFTKSMRDLTSSTENQAQSLKKSVQVLNAEIAGLPEGELKNKLKANVAYAERLTQASPQLLSLKTQELKNDFTEQGRNQLNSTTDGLESAYSEQLSLYQGFLGSTSNPYIQAKSEQFNAKLDKQRSLRENSKKQEDIKSEIVRRQLELDNIAITNDGSEASVERQKQLHAQIFTLTETRVQLEKNIADITTSSAIKIKNAVRAQKEALAELENKITLTKSQRMSETASTEGSLLQANAQIWESQNSKGGSRKAAQANLEANRISIANRQRENNVNSGVEIKKLNAELDKTTSIFASTSPEDEDTRNALMLQMQDIENNILAAKEKQTQVNQVLLAQSQAQEASARTQVSLTAELGQGMSDSARDGLRGFFSDLIDGTKSLNDTFKDFFDNLAKRFANLAMDSLFEKFVDPLFKPSPKKDLVSTTPLTAGVGKEGTLVADAVAKNQSTLVIKAPSIDALSNLEQNREAYVSAQPALPIGITGVAPDDLSFSEGDALVAEQIKALQTLTQFMAEQTNAISLLTQQLNQNLSSIGSPGKQPNLPVSNQVLNQGGQYPGYEAYIDNNGDTQYREVTNNSTLPESVGSMIKASEGLLNTNESPDEAYLDDNGVTQFRPKTSPPLAFPNIPVQSLPNQFSEVIEETPVDESQPNPGVTPVAKQPFNLKPFTQSAPVATPEPNKSSNALNNINNKVWDTLDNAAYTTLDAARGIRDSAEISYDNVINQVINTSNKVVGGVINNLPQNPINQVGTTLNQAGATLDKTGTSAVDTVTNTYTNIKNKAQDLFNGVKNWFSPDNKKNLQSNMQQQEIIVASSDMTGLIPPTPSSQPKVESYSKLIEALNFNLVEPVQTETYSKLMEALNLKTQAEPVQTETYSSLMEALNLKTQSEPETYSKLVEALNVNKSIQPSNQFEQFQPINPNEIEFDSVVDTKLPGLDENTQLDSEQILLSQIGNLSVESLVATINNASFSGGMIPPSVVSNPTSPVSQTVSNATAPTFSKLKSALGLGKTDLTQSNLVSPVLPKSIQLDDFFGLTNALPSNEMTTNPEPYAGLMSALKLNTNTYSPNSNLSIDSGNPLKALGGERKQEQNQVASGGWQGWAGAAMPLALSLGSTIAGKKKFNLGQTLMLALPMVMKAFGGGGFAKGGLVPGQGKRDTELILATPGEGILTLDAMQRIGGSKGLDAINKGKLDFSSPKQFESFAPGLINLPKFATGGTVGNTNYATYSNEYANSYGLPQNPVSQPITQTPITTQVSQVVTEGTSNKKGGGFSPLWLLGGVFGALLGSLFGKKKKKKKGKDKGDPLDNVKVSVADPDTKAARFASGGVVPGIGNQDTELIIATPGEGILTLDAMRRIGGSKGLDVLNNNKPGSNLVNLVQQNLPGKQELPKFAQGGVVGGLEVPMLPNTQTSDGKFFSSVPTRSNPADQAINSQLGLSPAASPGALQPIDVRYESVTIGEQKYVTEAQLRQSTNAAATAGANLALSQLRNSPNSRRTVGL